MVLILIRSQSIAKKIVTRLLADAGIIRNRLKVNAAIENAKRIPGIAKRSLVLSKAGWMRTIHSTKEEWTKLFRKTFVFTGGEIVNEFLMSTGYLAGAHDKDCPIYKKGGIAPPCLDAASSL